MKSLSKVLIGFVFGVVLLLFYVHGQNALFHISYDIEDGSDKLTHLSEEYRRLKFEVDQLKAPRLLEDKLKSLSLDLALPQEIRVIRVEAPAAFENTLIPDLPIHQPITNRFVNMLGHWVDVAQAKTDN
jgi:hypothetical protein